MSNIKNSQKELQVIKEDIDSLLQTQKNNNKIGNYNDYYFQSKFKIKNEFLNKQLLKCTDICSNTIFYIGEKSIKNTCLKECYKQVMEVNGIFEKYEDNNDELYKDEFMN